MESLKARKKVRIRNVIRIGNPINVQTDVPVIEKQPVKIGQLLVGFDKIASHPKRSEIMKAMFRGFDLDPYR